MSSSRSAKTGGWVAWFAVLAICCGLTARVPAYAQVVGATLSGTVTDPSSSIIPNAQVSIVNAGTGVPRNVTTNGDGYYTAPNLLPGSYGVTVAAAGFKTLVRSGVTLTVGAEQVLNLSMEVGQASQKVEVTGEAPTVELSSAALGDVVNSITVEELPLNGRDWSQLATLEPGVHRPDTQQAAYGGFIGPRGWGFQLIIAGTRPQENNYRIDGVTANDAAGGSPGSVLGFTLGVDAVAEFSVVTANQSAEYGRTSGGVINAITRSGSNQFHGDAYWFLRDEGMDSKGAFDSTRPPFHRNQFGGSVGGPIWKDKTFFFVNYEGFRQDLGTTSVNNVPSANARNGIISTAGAPLASCPSGSTLLVPGSSNVCVSNAVIPYLPLYPLPNAGLVGAGDIGHFNVVGSTTSTENFITNRIDQKISAKDSLSFVWLYDWASILAPSSLNLVLNGNQSKRASGSLEETHTFSSSLLNIFRIGYSLNYPIQNQPVKALVPLAADTSLGAVPGQAAPWINVAGLPSVQPLASVTTQGQSFNSYQLYDDAFLTKGAHTFKFGFAVEYDRHNASTLGFVAGQFAFPSLLGLLQNQPTNFRGPSTRTVFFRQTLVGGYFSDDWHVRPNLTLNLGLRYETMMDLHEANNQLSNLQSISAPAPFLGVPTIQNPTRHNFEPRVGFAWDPFRDGKTSVRGAFGMFDIFPMSSEFMAAEISVAPFVKGGLTVGGLAQGSFPTILTTDLGNSPLPGQLKYLSAEYIPHRNYVMIWNLSVQRQLTPSTSVTLGYVGNHGVHMLNMNSDDGNVVLPTVTSAGLMWPNPIGSGTKVNPALGAIAVQTWGGSSLYDALLASLTKKLSHGLQGQVAYTWSKGLDTGSAATVSDEYTNSLVNPYWFCPSCMRGLSDFNIAQDITFSLTWDAPTPNHWGGVASHVLGGWELGAIFTAHTGTPITPVITGNPLGENGSAPLDFPSRLQSAACANPVNPGSINYVNLSCFTLPSLPASNPLSANCVAFKAAPGTCANLAGEAGRNSIIGPGFVNLDFSLFKNNYIRRISETFNVQFRAEVFNILNHQNFATPFDNNAFFDGTGTPIPGAGQIDALVGTARQVQLALKVIW